MAFLRFPTSCKAGSNSLPNRGRQRRTLLAAPVTSKLWLEALEDRTVPSTVTWTGGGGDSNWDNAANWSTASVPGPGDAAVINFPGVITHSTSLTSTVNSLTLSQATLTLTAPLTVTGQMSVTGQMVVDGCTLNIGANCVATFENAVVFLGQAAEINNYSSNFTTQGDVRIQGDLSGYGTFNNDGIILESNQMPSGLLVFNFGETLNNSGSIEAQTGTFLLIRAEGIHSGSFLGDPGSDIFFSAVGGGPNIFAATSQVVGDNVRFSADPYKFYGRYEANETQLVGDGFDYVAFLNPAILPSFGHKLSILGQPGSGPTLDLTGIRPTAFALDSLTIAGHGTVRGAVEFDVGQTAISGPGSDVILDGTTIRTDTIAATPDAIVELVNNAEIIVGGSRLYQGLVAGTGTTMSAGSQTLLGQPVTFVATVGTSAAGLGTPTGTVDFFDTTTNTDLGSVSLSSGSVSLTTSALAAGSNVIRVSYSGDSTFLPSLAVVNQQVHYTFSGFLAPLNSNLALALNRTVPIKFQLTDAKGKYISSLGAVVSLQVLNVQGVNVLTNTGGTAIRYDASTNQFIVNWRTKGLPAGTYTVTLALADGTTYPKVVQLSVNGGSAGLLVEGTDLTTTVVGALLAGDLTLYVANANGDLTADELARIQDAVTAVDALTESYGVTVTEVTDPAMADITMDINTTSALGGYAQGVLGCTTDDGQITLVQGWDWYLGADASGIGPGQYDFQTVVTHELGHALGLGHSEDANSVMSATLGTGTVHRVLTAADLNVSDQNPGADGERAAPPPAAGTSTPFGVWVAADPLRPETTGVFLRRHRSEPDVPGAALPFAHRTIPGLPEDAAPGRPSLALAGSVVGLPAPWPGERVEISDATPDAAHLCRSTVGVPARPAAEVGGPTKEPEGLEVAAHSLHAGGVLAALWETTRVEAPSAGTTAVHPRATGYHFPAAEVSRGWPRSSEGTGPSLGSLTDRLELDDLTSWDAPLDRVACDWLFAFVGAVGIFAAGDPRKPAATEDVPRRSGRATQ